MKTLHCIVSLVVLFAVSAPADAAIINWVANLSGAQEVPPNASLATGTGFGTYDTVTNLLSWTVIYAGMSGPLTGGHFHRAPVGVNGPIIVNIGTGASPIVGSIAIAESDEPSLLGGNVYINLHTAAYPGGEIRGQVETPEPTTVTLMAAGLLAIASLRGRRNRSR